MKKSTICLAITSVFMSAGAFADTANVSVYGRVEASINSSDINNGNDDVFLDSTSIETNETNGDDSVATGGSSNKNFFGVRGSEDLGNGLSAIFQLEYGVDVTNAYGSSNSLVGRDRWIGLTGEFGTMTFGTQITSYASDTVDPFNNTALNAYTHGSESILMHDDFSGTAGEGRASNTIKYQSPKLMDAITATAHWTVGTSSDGNDDESNLSDDGAWGVGANYDANNVFAYADYITSDKGGDDDAWKVGGRYTYDSAAIFAQYENDGGLISDMAGYDGGDIGDTEFENTVNGSDTWMLGGTYSLGSTDVSLAYGNKDDSNAAGDDAYDVITVGAIHHLSDRTNAYGGYSETNGDAPDSNDLQFWTVGLGHTF